jgi:hypothetical protein
MAKQITKREPLYVVVNLANKVLAHADTMIEAIQNRNTDPENLRIKLFADYKRGV